MICLNYFYYEMNFNNTSYWLKHGATKSDHEYLEPMITAADYVDDLYEEEYASVIVEVDNFAGPWVYRHEQKIPNIDTKKKTHTEFGFVGRLPGLKRKKC